MDTPLVPGRECGTCNVCCVALTINEPALQKAQGYRCRNAQPDNRCGIYQDRPRTCRNFDCGWRQLKWVRETMRPDVSGVLVQMHRKVYPDHSVSPMGIMVTLLTRAALKAEGLAETVSAAVAANVTVMLQVPGPPGHTYGQAQINDALLGPVRARDKAGVLEVLRQARTAGLKGEHRPITFKPYPAPDEAAADGTSIAPKDTPVSEPAPSATSLSETGLR